MKLKVGQRICLVISIVLYIGFLFSFVQSVNYGILGCTIGMFVFFLLILMMGVPKEKKEDDEVAADWDDGIEEDEAVRDRVHVNSLIDQLVSMNALPKIDSTKDKPLSSNQIDSMITEFKSKLETAIQTAQSTGYGLSGAAPQPGTLFSIDA